MVWLEGGQWEVRGACDSPTGGVAGLGSFTPTPAPPPPPPPPPLKLASKCWTIGAKDAESKFCVMWQRAKKLCFHPICLYSIYSEFSGEINNGQKWVFFQSVRNNYPTSEESFSEMATTLVGGTLY